MLDTSCWWKISSVAMLVADGALCRPAFPQCRVRYPVGINRGCKSPQAGRLVCRCSKKRVSVEHGANAVAPLVPMFVIVSWR
jgi:hypothetical protein